MKQTLKDHFSIIRDREEVIADIQNKESLLKIYNKWNANQQKLFLDYCTGIRGVKIIRKTVHFYFGKCAF